MVVPFLLRQRKIGEIELSWFFFKTTEKMKIFREHSQIIHEGIPKSHSKYINYTMKVKTNFWWINQFI